MTKSGLPLVSALGLLEFGKMDMQAGLVRKGLVTK